MEIVRAVGLTTIGAALTSALWSCGNNDHLSFDTTVAAIASPRRDPAKEPPMEGHTGIPSRTAGAGRKIGNPDRDFLRMMSDHHKGLAQMAQMVKGKKDAGVVAQEAAKLDAEQDEDLSRMISMLEKNFTDIYAPHAIPEHQQMAIELETKSGKDYERTFYKDIIRHHQEAVKMIDDYLPRAKDAMVRQIAERMRATQSREIAEFQRKVDAPESNSH